MLKISIIIPVYNPGEALCQCIDSLLNQTFRDLEFIFVLDYPTDGTDVYLESYASKDDRIVVIRNDRNLHIGLSRNVGLNVARGEYIGFSDDDDYMSPNMYEKLYKKIIENDSDVVLSITVNEESNSRHVFYYPRDIANLRNFALADLIGNGNVERDYPLAINIHSNLYKRKLLLDHDIRFIDTRKVIPEDRLFNIMVLAHAQKVALVNEPLYYHVIRTESAGHQQSYFDPVRRLAYVDEVYNVLEKANILDKYKKNFNIGVQKIYIQILLSALSSSHNLFKYFILINEMKKRRFCKSVFKAKHEFKRNLSILWRGLETISILLLRI